MSYSIPYMWNLKRHDINELIYQTNGCWGGWTVGHVHTAILKLDDHQGPSV